METPTKLPREFAKALSWEARRSYREERRSTVKSIDQKNTLGLQARILKKQRISERRLSGRKQTFNDFYNPTKGPGKVLW
jgi:hypothetical protein